MAARVAVGHPEQGWSLLCYGVVLFEDAGVTATRRSDRAGGMWRTERMSGWPGGGGSKLRLRPRAAGRDVGTTPAVRSFFTTALAAVQPKVMGDAVLQRNRHGWVPASDPR